ncbi:MAG TPA: hypothetical protein PLQ76_10000 [bacterium]|nr:hypothetical protein [bacterium]
MIADLIEFLKKELLPLVAPKEKCKHEGQTHEYCGHCGADLRVVTSLECRLCELTGRVSVFTNESCPDFCTTCGAPRITFRKILKKRARFDEKITR